MEGSIRLILGCDRFTAATEELPVATAPSHPPARRGTERERQTGEGDNLPPALPRRDAWENPSEVGGGRIVCPWSGWLEVAVLVGEAAQELKQRMVLGG